MNICRFCSADGICKDISTKYYYLGQQETYTDMIKDIFNIQMPHLSFSSSICENCIARLRDAKSFKDIIIRSQEELSKCSVFETEEVQIKQEYLADEVLEESVDDRDSDSDEILFDMKLDLNHRENDKDMKSTPETFNDQLIIKKPKAKTPKEKVCVNTKPEKDWSKIAERRGTGPLLREASLRLIDNSTACVFQWNKSRYRCFCCTEPFSDINLLRQHTNTAHTSEDIKRKIITQQNRLVKVEISTLFCKICGVRLENLIKLRDHLKTHNLEFESDEDLLVPFKIDENNLKCQICDQNFTLFRLLNIHMNKHYQKQVCHICGAGFSNLVFLNLHKSRSHRPFSCKDCKMVFNDRIAKKNHDISVHKVIVQRKLRFPCPYCKERFFQENYRVQHLIDKHGMAKPEFQCNVCLKTFITKSLLNNHVKKVHLKEKNSECDVCHRLFYAKSDVLRHRVTHTGVKKFSCSLCNNPFSTKDSLKRHIKRSHGGVVI